MRRSRVLLSLLSVAVACTPGRRKDDIKQVQLTADHLKAQQSGTPYVVEVNRGTLYEVPAGVDPSLVEVRDPAGSVPLRVLARRFVGSGKPVLIGNFDDLSARDFGFPPDAGVPQPGDTVLAAQCAKPTADSPGICNCTGKKDCNDMNKAGLCTGGSNKSAVCGNDANGKWGCSCVAKGS